MTTSPNAPPAPTEILIRGNRWRMLGLALFLALIAFVFGKAGANPDYEARLRHHAECVRMVGHPQGGRCGPAPSRPRSGELPKPLALVLCAFFGGAALWHGRRALDPQPLWTFDAQGIRGDYRTIPWSDIKEFRWVRGNRMETLMLHRNSEKRAIPFDPNDLGLSQARVADLMHPFSPAAAQSYRSALTAEQTRQAARQARRRAAVEGAGYEGMDENNPALRRIIEAERS